MFVGSRQSSTFKNGFSMLSVVQKKWKDILKFLEKPFQNGKPLPFLIFGYHYHKTIPNAKKNYTLMKNCQLNFNLVADHASDFQFR